MNNEIIIGIAIIILVVLIWKNKNKNKKIDSLQDLAKIGDMDYKQFEFSDKQWERYEPYFYIDFGNKVAYIDGTLVWNLVSEPEYMGQVNVIV